MKIKSTDTKWYAVYTRYKCEKMVAQLLTKKNIEVYLPLTLVIKVWGKQKRKKYFPLINSYVFVKVAQPEFVRVLETEKVIQFIQFNGKPASIPEEEIDLLKQVVGDKRLFVEAYSSDLKKGDFVQIIGGSLTGLQGVLKELRGNKNVLVQLDKLGYTLDISVRRELVVSI